jgi:hypothetical protein
MTMFATLMKWCLVADLLCEVVILQLQGNLKLRELFVVYLHVILLTLHFKCTWARKMQPRSHQTTQIGRHVHYGAREYLLNYSGSFGLSHVYTSLADQANTEIGISW